MRAAVCLLLTITTGCRRPPDGSTYAYPPTRTVDVVDVYHGKTVADPYRWLEDLSSPEVREWAEAQRRIALPLMRENDVRPWLARRIDALGAGWVAYESVVHETSSPIVDRSTLEPGAAVLGTWPSPDRRHIAYAVSQQGSDWGVMRIRRQSDGFDLPERLEGLLWAKAAWTRDNGGFFYQRTQRAAAGARTMLRAAAVYYHRLGSSQNDDVPVFRTPEATTDLVVDIGLSDGGRDLFIYEGNGADVDGIGWLLTRVHVMDLGRAPHPTLTNPPVALTTDRVAAYRLIASDADSWFLLTDRGAPRRRVVAVSRVDPSPARWRDVIPESADVLDRVYAVGGRFAAVYRHDVQDGVIVFDRTGRLLRKLAIGPLRTVLAVQAGRDDHELVVHTMSFLVPPTRSRHHLDSGAITVETPPVPVSSVDIEVRQHWYASKDGTRVPMFVLHRRDLIRDGSHPSLLIGYGGSSTSSRPEFAEHAIAWIEMGGIVAVPAIRGGGEFGRAWYEAAILERKQTTFDDFIAAAEYLIAERYTSREKLVAQGRSNGGLLVASVLTQRPDLFRVAIAEVPITDTLRYDRGRHAPQFGSAQDPAQFDFLFAYSPQHHAKAGTCYPATLVTTALNDDRAPAWLPMKFAAAVQAAQSCRRPVVLRADPAGGHTGDYISDAADALAFAARELGMRPPAPVPNGR